jgi:hypothetical protein
MEVGCRFSLCYNCQLTKPAAHLGVRNPVFLCDSWPLLEVGANFILLYSW